jgi:enoyl-CoA hydratase/carnithine racemase
MENESRVRVRIEDHVAEVVLNRPDKRNGLDLAMFEGIVAAAEQIRGDLGVRAVVLRGEGKAFCAGLDWQFFMTADESARARMLERGASSPANLAQRVGWIWQELPVPVICAVHGAAFGGGLQIALGADIRLLGPEAQLSVMEIKYGLVPDMSATQTLLKLVRPDVAKELTFTGRIVGPEEAVKLGLGTRVVADPVAEALALAKEIAKKSPQAIRAIKKLFNAAPSLDVRAAFALETDEQLLLLGSPNQMEAAMAVMQKREPSFEDPTS